MLNERDVVTELLNRVQREATGVFGQQAASLVQQVSARICASEDVRHQVDMLARVTGFDRFATRLQWVLESARLDGSVPRTSVLALEARTLFDELRPFLDQTYKKEGGHGMPMPDALKTSQQPSTRT